MRCVGEVKGLSAELQCPALSKLEVAEEREIGIEAPGPSQRIETGVAEARLRNRSKGERIKIRIGTDSAHDLHRWLYAIGDLNAPSGNVQCSRRIQRSRSGGDREWFAGVCAYQCVDLPAAKHC